MLHQDGSRAAWLAEQPPLDLIVTMDDATSTIYSAFLVEEEGTASTFQALLEVFTAHGLPSSLYTDRGSHYFHTPTADGPVDKEQTDPGRPGAEAAGNRAHPGLFAGSARAHRADVRHSAGSPDQGTGEGRHHRDRCRQYAGSARSICRPTMRASPNRPRLPESAFVTADAALLAETLCVQEERVVGPRQHGELQRAQAAAARKPAARITSSRRGCAFITIRTARSPCSTARAASPAITPHGDAADRQRSRPPKRDTVLAAVKAWPGSRSARRSARSDGHP